MSQSAPDPADLPIFAAHPDQTGSRRRNLSGATVRARLAAPSNPPEHDEDAAAHPPLTHALGTVLPPPVFGDDMTLSRHAPAPNPADLTRSARPIDWQLVAAFRAQASDLLSSATAAAPTGADREGERELGRSIITEMLAAAAADSVSEGREAWTANEQEALAAAIFNAVFGLGRLQSLVDDDTVENIIVSGHANVWLDRTDGSLTRVAPVADSDEELIDFLSFLASRSEVNPRPFSPSHPNLDLRLDGGARLAASAWVTPRPSVVIRRHRLNSVTLADLVERGTITAVTASFLQAAVRARKSIVVAGAQGAGKTTLVRALCAAIDPWESIGTFETEYELHLHDLPDQHHIVHAFEARPGSGEIGADGRQAGEFTLDEALYRSFRLNLSRQIVGEVRGKEVFAMIKAMESGAGSISTTHANNADAAIRKLITCAMEAGSHVTAELATAKLAETVDLVVYLHLETVQESATKTTRARWVSQILAVGPGEAAKGYASTRVFTSRGAGPALAETLPEELGDLTGYGFDLEAFLAEAASERSVTA